MRGATAAFVAPSSVSAFGRSTFSHKGRREVGVACGSRLGFRLAPHHEVAGLTGCSGPVPTPRPEVRGGAEPRRTAAGAMVPSFSLPDGEVAPKWSRGAFHAHRRLSAPRPATLPTRGRGPLHRRTISVGP